MRRVATIGLAVIGLLASCHGLVAAQAPGAQSQAQQNVPVYKVGTVTIKFVGTASVNEQIVRANMQIREGGEFDEVTLDRDIRSLYRTGLFEFIEVKHEAVNAQTFNLVVEVTPKFRVFAVRFEGNVKVKSTRLEKEAKTRPNQALDERQVKDDTEKLREYYQKAGYNQVSVSYTIERDRVGGFGTVIFKIREGAKVKIAGIQYVGNKSIPASKLKGQIETKKWWMFSWLTGSGRYKDDEFEDDLDKLRDYYREQGFLDVEIPQEKVMFNYPAPDKLVIVVNIIEGRRYRVGEIIIEGNNKTKSTVILRELVLGPGDVFSTVLMKISQLRLDNTRFFESADVSPQETNIPGRRNLRIAVREGRTGNLTFGAGFSSVEQATLFAEVSQSNFDLFNRRSFFQGDGQKFRLRMQLGSVSSEVVLSFEEPWLFQKQLGLGFSVFRTSSDYNSTFYTQIQSGFEVYLRKHLWELWNGRLSYTYEIYNIDNVSDSASPQIRSLAGKNQSSTIGFQLERDTRDKIINTTSGNRVEVNLKFTGGPLGGSDINNNYSVEFRGSQFFPVFEAQTQVLSLIARTGVVQNFSPAIDVPYYNKWYLGGPTTLRGFEFRDVSPRDIFGEPIGGQTYAFFSAEYSLDIVSPIRFAIFYDVGFVNRKAFDYSPNGYNDNFGFGLRLFVAGAPLSLDFGIPLTTSLVNDKGNQFNFSFGTRF